jgi:hypothetical protein
MPVTINLKTIVDIPMWQPLKPLPATAAAGCCLCNDKRLTDRYVYFLFSATGFWRYDTWTDGWQQLPSPPSFAFGAGTTMTFDPSRGTAGYVWLFGPSSSSPYAVFAYFDVAANAWTSRNAPSGLGSAWSSDADLCHPCTTYNAGGDDDKIYLIGNASTTWYVFSISGNSWSTMATAITGAVSTGCAIFWPWAYGTGYLYIVRGGGNSTIYIYNIGTPGFTTMSYVPSTDTFGTGSCIAYDGGTYVYFQKDNVNRLSRLKMQASPIMESAGQILYGTAPAAHVGQGMFLVKSTDGVLFLYYRVQSGTLMLRTLIFW